MDNYEYTIASLPVLRQDTASADHIDVKKLTSEIRDQLSFKDQALVDLLLSGYDPDSLNYSFYFNALNHRNRFIRKYFEYDMNVRNAKVEYLNKALGRLEGQDTIVIENREQAEFDDRQRVDEILASSDILARERGLDDIMWQKIDEITISDVFDIEFILGFLAKLNIIGRWLKLDPETGRTMFRQLVDDIRKTYDNKKQNDI